MRKGPADDRKRTAAAGSRLAGDRHHGAGMGRNIARAGIRLRVWNRTRDRAEPLAADGAVADSPAGAVRGAGIIVTSFDG